MALSSQGKTTLLKNLHLKSTLIQELKYLISLIFSLKKTIKQNKNLKFTGKQNLNNKNFNIFIRYVMSKIKGNVLCQLKSIYIER